MEGHGRDLQCNYFGDKIISMTISQYFLDHLLLVPTIAWLASIIGKGIWLLAIGRFSVPLMLSSGGMPSSHSALATSMATALGIKYGVNSDYFMIGLIVSLIIIYDAMNVRFEAGLHAKVLNELTGREHDFNESIGHLPSEAFAGSLLGMSVAVICLI